MCHFELSIESIEIAHLIDFKSYFADELLDLREMEKGGLLTIDDQWISVSRAAACWCGASPWPSTATCAPTANASATPKSSEPFGWLPSGGRARMPCDAVSDAPRDSAGRFFFCGSRPCLKPAISQFS
jgi:hypothetical protein